MKSKSKRDVLAHTTNGVHSSNQTNSKIEKKNSEKKVEQDEVRINNKSVKRLLSQKKRLTGLQVGRILFLNVCKLFAGEGQIYSYQEYIELVNKLQPTEEEVGAYVFYQRLATHSVDTLNDLRANDVTALRGFRYLHLQIKLIKENPNSKLIAPDGIMDSILDIRGALQYIHSYALFFDAVRSILKHDRRITPAYRLLPESRRVMKEAKKYDEYIEKNFTAEDRSKYKLNYIGEIPRVYIEHKPKPKTIKKIIDYLMFEFDYHKSIDRVTRAEVTLYINNHFPRD